jgi:hypothetical protein
MKSHDEIGKYTHLSAVSNQPAILWDLHNRLARHASIRKQALS